MSVRIIKGDVREKLAELPADHFDCIVTSPPYYGLRDYGTAKWEGGDPACDHRQESTHVGPKSTLRNDGRDHVGPYDGEKAVTDGLPFKSICGHCGARRIDAQIGLEPTLDAYLETIVAVCRELRRVLKPSGVFFLVIGDSYSGAGYSNHTNTGGAQRKDGGKQKHTNVIGMKPKDLMLVPHRLGIALQDDGWWVRSDIIWSKKNPMPESCHDRPTSAHETVWMLTKSSRYFWDGEAVREDNSPTSSMGRSFKNVRNVWTFASHPFPQAHFATFPPELAERCIKAGSSERGCCPACGKPWVRVVEHSAGTCESNTRPKQTGGMSSKTSTLSLSGSSNGWNERGGKRSYLGWQPSCKCSDAAPIPARILDPFAGAGTAGLVADRLCRDCTLIDLNTDYAEMALNRIKDDCPMFAEVAAE